MNVGHFYTVLPKSRVENQDKKASMIFLLREASNKDESENGDDGCLHGRIS